MLKESFTKSIEKVFKTWLNITSQRTVTGMCWMFSWKFHMHILMGWWYCSCRALLLYYIVSWSYLERLPYKTFHDYWYLSAMQDLKEMGTPISCFQVYTATWHEHQSGERCAHLSRHKERREKGSLSQLTTPPWGRTFNLRESWSHNG